MATQAPLPLIPARNMAFESIEMLAGQMRRINASAIGAEAVHLSS